MLAVFYELDVEISSVDFGSKLLNDSDRKLIRRSVGLIEASRASFGPVLNHGQPDSLIAELEDRQSFHVDIVLHGSRFRHRFSRGFWTALIANQTCLAKRASKVTIGSL